ncbi:DNA polymerase ligase N-terminal domain-containing protein [Bremerella alba]|uniref:DNA ligase D 3'-phosphoesterase domain-containing protein n=1 Tax=Bremerella alba TaxID=980252 RepID=A0A7V8V9Q3_9BACT|nr:DNA polymerase ligase N-terminal domain-containing protein [Bremerella alba]MBA2117544.1 hypothetical protein [Bremerella alba]
MPRYAILHHTTPSNAEKPDHYDLLLEDGDLLKTFTLESFPEVGLPVRAIADFDHRLIYLDYEGPVSDNRGEVTRADEGTFSWIIRQDDLATVHLQGERLQGRLILEIQDSSGDSCMGDEAGGS